MFLRSKTRKKDGKIHRYWSVVENKRVSGGRVVQRQVLYLGELNDAQRAGWIRTIDSLEPRTHKARQLALFPDDRGEMPDAPCEVARILLKEIALRRPRQWGACWLSLHLWEMLELDVFWRDLLPNSRKGTSWLNVLKALVCYRLIDPGSEFRFHREWYERSAMGDLLGEDFALAQKDKPYRCMDKLLEHREALFEHLRDRWGELFNAKYDVLLYDLTSTYFESDPPPADSASKKRFGYSRDHRSDCVQVVVALVVTPEGFPVAYEVYPGNTRDTATLRDFLQRIEQRYGKTGRTWLMDRGIPTEETLEEMREDNIQYLVGTPKGRLTKLENALLDKPWSQAREDVRVKILTQDDEFYIYVQSQARVAKERGMRRRRLKKLWARLNELRSRPKLKRDALLMALGAAKKEAGRVWSLVDVQVPQPHQAVNSETFRFELNRGKFRRAIRREDRYLFRKFAPDQSSSVCSKRKGERAGTGYGLGVFKPLPVPGFRRSNETHSQQSPEFSLLSEWPKAGHDQLLRSNMKAQAPETVWENYLLLTRNRTSVQGPENRPGHPPDPPSTRTANRSAHLPQFPRLLPAHHAEKPGQRKRDRTDQQRNPRQNVNDPNGRRASSHHRRPAHRPQPLHTTRSRPRLAADRAAIVLAPTAPAQGLRVGKSRRLTACSADLRETLAENTELTSPTPRQLRRSG